MRGSADLPLLVFDGDLGVELIFLDRAFLLHGGVAAEEDGFVSLEQQLLARLRLQRAQFPASA